MTSKAYVANVGKRPKVNDLGESAEFLGCPTLRPFALNRRHNPSTWVTVDRLQESQAQHKKESEARDKRKNLLKQVNQTITQRQTKALDDLKAAENSLVMQEYNPQETRLAALYGLEGINPQQDSDQKYT